jgi:hypothetical protein
MEIEIPKYGQVDSEIFAETGKRNHALQMDGAEPHE